MKVLFFINTLGGGGAEKLLVDLIKKLNDKYDIYLYTLVNKGVYLEELPANIHYKSMITTKNRILCLFLQYLYVFFLPSNLVYRLFFKEKFDVEVAFLEGPTTKILSRSTNKKSLKIAWVHYDLYNKFTIRKMYPFMKQHIECYRRFDNIVCVCDETKDNFIKRFGFDDNVIVLNNFIDMDKIISLSYEPISIANDKIIFTSIGRLVDDKGFSHLLKIYKNLNDRYPSTFEAYIIGDGPNKNEMLNFLQDNSLSNVHLINFTLNPYSYLANSDYFISSSLREGFGLVLVESLALNVPIISTKTSGSMEIIKNENYGYLCDDFNQLEEKLSSIVQEGKKINNSNTEMFARGYDISTQLNKIKKLFEGGYHVKKTN